MAVADVKAVFQDNDRTVLIAVVRQQCLADDAEVFVQNHNRTGPTAETPNVLLVVFGIDLRCRGGEAVIDFAVFVVVDVMIKLLLVAFSQIII